MAELKSRTFECMGVELTGGEGDQRIGDCPFCRKEQHFFVNAKTGQWDCKVCGRVGNTFTFLEKICKTWLGRTKPEKWAELAKKRSQLQGRQVEPGFPPEVFKRYKLAFNADSHEWIFPAISEKNTVRDIRRWNGTKTMATEGCHLQLFGLDELSKAPKGSIVWLCEGEWDAIVLRWYLDLAGFKAHIVVATPGAGVFKQEWVDYFRGMHVRSCYDNDTSGDEGGQKSGRLLAGVVASLKFLHWSESRPSGWDLRDYILSCMEKKRAPKDAIAILEKVLKSKHRRDVEDISPDAEVKSKETAIEFPEVVKEFSKWMRMDTDIEDGLAVSLAVCLANDIPGDPLWLYLVGPPGGGKTVILMSLQDSDRTKFYSTLTPASLVSGFNVHPDPSLLPKLDGHAAIFKDGTELLALHPDARQQIYGVLRGAFDGFVYKPFGNGVVREYRLHFNLIIGITPAVHGDGTATMGERFLKFEMRDKDAEHKIRKALDNIAQEVEMESELSSASRRFLLKKVDPTLLPGIPENIIDRIVALAQILSILRAQVEREVGQDRDLKYRPGHEIGTRIAKQLAKLGQMLTFVFGVPRIDDRIYKILKKVAFDTAIGFHLDILRVLCRTSGPGLDRDTIAKESRIPSVTCMKRLHDLEQLNVIRKEMFERPVNRLGPTPARWSVIPEIRKLWYRANPASNGLFKRSTPQSVPAAQPTPKKRPFMA